jgi:elongation factor P
LAAATTRPAVREHRQQGDNAVVATTNDLKNGLVLNIDGQLWTVTEFQHVKPGKGGAFVRTTLKNVLTGKVVDRTFNAGTKVEVAQVDKRDMTFLYREGTDFVFMDKSTYDQMYVPAQTVGGNADYMLENTDAIVAVHDNEALYVELPASVELVVSHTDPGLQGDRSTGGTKPATPSTSRTVCSGTGGVSSASRSRSSARRSPLRMSAS